MSCLCRRWPWTLLLALAACSPQSNVKIGVLLPLSGPADIGQRTPIEWATANINAAGGLAGAQLELVLADTAVEDAAAAAMRLAHDPSVLAVVGPDTSALAADLAPMFIDAQKPLISPSATSGDLFRMFGGRRFFWRTVESDIAQVQALVMVARRSGAQKVALVATNDSYGNTFFDWFGFFATELKLQVSAVLRLDADDCGPKLAEVVAGRPDALVVVSPSVTISACFVRGVAATAPGMRLLFSDSSFDPGLIAALGAQAEGLEGTALSSDPSSGFDIAWRVRYGSRPSPYAANAYDAVLLAAYGLEQANGQGGEQLAAGMMHIANGTGRDIGWDEDGIPEALAAIRAGETPALMGAAGPLRFDPDLYTDYSSSTYGHWRVDHGEFVVVEHLSTGASNRGTSLARSFGSQEQMQNLSAAGSYQPGPRSGAWAMIAAVSSGWRNYRHQADALAQYQKLRASGFSDDHIVLIMEDDLANDSHNEQPGVVRNQANGPNLRDGAVIDYKAHDLDASDLLAILSGSASDRAPTVLQSTSGDDVYVFMVGHGNDEGLLVNEDGVGSTRAVTQLGPQMLQDAVSAMFQAGRYRQLLLVIEMCHGGLLGTKLSVPGAVLMAGANPFESSFGTNYDTALGAWLADEFAYQILVAASHQPNMPLDSLYRELYLNVGGSHVTVYNSNNFGGLQQATLAQFFTP